MPQASHRTERITSHHVEGALHHGNLDEHPAFEGKRSTPELIARYIHRELGRKLPVSAGSALTITLHESPLVWVRYRAPLRGASVMPTELA